MPLDQTLMMMCFLLFLLLPLVLASLEGVRQLPLVLSGDGWTEPAIELRDGEGNLYSCIAQRSTIKNKTETTLKGLVSRLDGACARINQGWWTYEWCHRRQIRQFHVDLPAGIADPVWSLGAYTKSETMSNKAINTSPYESIKLLTDVYASGGQWCDETLTGRKTRVSFSCCTDSHSASRTSSQKKNAGGGRIWTPNKSANDDDKATAYIISVQEIAICEYAMEVCSPILCQPGKNTQSVNATLASYLKPLEGMCVQRHENWWSFEFCFKRHARQFHLEAETKNGKRTMNTVADFSLGYFIDDERTQLTLVNQEQNLPPGFSIPGSEGEPRIEFEYINGTPCDLELSEPRASTIRITCGETNSLVSVVEDYSCHYILTVTTPAICKHPVFSKQIPTRTVSCQLIDEKKESHTPSPSFTNAGAPEPAPPPKTCSADEDACPDPAVPSHPADRRRHISPSNTAGH